MPVEKIAKIIVLFFAITQSQSEAELIVKHLMREGLIQKALVAPSTAFMNTNNKISRGKEYILFTMVSEQMLVSVMEAVKAKHSDPDPCMLAIPVIANDSYASNYIPTHASASAILEYDNGDALF